MLAKTGGFLVRHYTEAGGEKVPTQRIEKNH
jgi:hypothetical protein